MKNLYIKQKVLSLGGKFTVTDAQENPLYFVEGSFAKIPKTYTVFNQQRQQIGLVTKKVFSLLPKFFVEVNGEEMVTITKELSFLKARYSVDIHGLEVQGNWWDMDFQVTKQGQPVAEIHQRWFTWGDTYEVAIYDESLQDLLVCLVIAIDRVKADEAAAASS